MSLSYQELQAQLGAKVRLDEPLLRHSWWKIGGPADCFVEVEDTSDVLRATTFCRSYGIPFCVIGRTTNLLFDDVGFRGCIIRIGEKLCRITIRDSKIDVQAGAWTPVVALRAARAGLSGIEHTIGIPASFGGLIYMNGGSMRRGIGEVVDEVTVMTQEGKERVFSARDCEFSYRQSRFQCSGETILSARLHLPEMRNYNDQRPELLRILRERGKKFPRKLPSCGSVFKSSPELYAAHGPPGKIIEELGFKGRRRGNIQVSPQHANFIVNLGGGSSADVLALVVELQDAVWANYGARLDPEFRYLDPNLGLRELHPR